MFPTSDNAPVPCHMQMRREGHTLHSTGSTSSRTWPFSLYVHWRLIWWQALKETHSSYLQHRSTTGTAAASSTGTQRYQQQQTLDRAGKMHRFLFGEHRSATIEGPAKAQTTPALINICSHVLTVGVRPLASGGAGPAAPPSALCGVPGLSPCSGPCSAASRGASPSALCCVPGLSPCSAASRRGLAPSPPEPVFL